LPNGVSYPQMMKNEKAPIGYRRDEDRKGNTKWEERHLSRVGRYDGRITIKWGQDSNP